jgi:hypothetical protein
VTFNDHILANEDHFTEKSGGILELNPAVLIGAYVGYSAGVLETPASISYDGVTGEIVMGDFSCLLFDNPNKYGVDLISKDATLQVEVEHRVIWKHEEFPFEDVNVPERKMKFFTENHICYAILSSDYSHIGLIDGKTLRKHLVEDNLKESSNKYMKEGEYFYKVPKSEFKWDKV